MIAQWSDKWCILSWPYIIDEAPAIALISARMMYWKMSLPDWSYFAHAVHTKICGHGSCLLVLCCVLYWYTLPISLRIDSLALEHLYDCPMMPPWYIRAHVEDLVQGCGNSIANALELPQFCTRLSMYPLNIKQKPKGQRNTWYNFPLYGLYTVYRWRCARLQ